MKKQNGAQYAILRFAKYKGPAIGNIEAHNERKKEKYASNPDIDTNRSALNFHLIAPQQKYRTEAERQIATAGCRTRKDSVRMVETLITASPNFFKGKKRSEVNAYFSEAVRFIENHQPKETMISAVVHLDEKTPHMHLTFVPLTADNRLSAKVIIGNRKKLIWWQDEFWKHMVKKYPDLERGKSASETGRDHIPPRVYKDAVHLNQQKELLTKLLSEISPFNSGRKSAEIEAVLERYIPNVEKMRTQLKKYDGAYTQLKRDNTRLERAVDASKESVLERLETMQRLRELENLRQTVEAIPPELLERYTHTKKQAQDKHI